MSGRDIIVECAGKEASINVKCSKRAGRQIILEMDKDTRRIVLNKLQMLTNDELSVNDKDFTVEIKKIIEKDTKKLGTELIRNLIQPGGHNLKTVKIIVVYGENYTSPDGELKEAQNWPGTNATIGINIMEEFVVPTINNKGTYNEKDTMPLHIILAHELIHAYHIVNGELESNEPMTYTYYYKDKTGKLQDKTEDNVNREELYTMGVSGYEKKHITENKIREEQNKIIEERNKTKEEQQQKLNKRIGYGKPPRNTQ